VSESGSGLAEAVVGELDGVERYTLRSVGIDVGSATTHLVFSQLILRRQGGALSSRFAVAQQEVLYRSPILLTPYSSPDTIDASEVGAFIWRAYAAAGLAPDDVDTGAVVVTGEALKKHNSEAIIRELSDTTGKFVCASAGPAHEALLAAHGSRAVRLSKEHKSNVLSVDIGGGSTKFALVRSGTITQISAVEVGGRLLSFGPGAEVTRLERPLERVLADLGLALSLGDIVDPTVVDRIAQRMADVVIASATGGAQMGLASDLALMDPLPAFEVDAVVFSGGVAEFMLDRAAATQGDLGRALAEAVLLRARHAFGDDRIVIPDGAIRATVIGAGQYSLQVSGSTSHLSDQASLPVRGVPVASVSVASDDSTDAIEAAIRTALRNHDRVELDAGVVLAISSQGNHDFETLCRLATGIRRTMSPGDSAIFLIVDADIAKSIGAILSEELAVSRTVTVLDGIDVGDLDFVDIGRPIGTSESVPVVVKSLVFEIRSKADPVTDAIEQRRVPAG
jgi:ethanolamine utilization protein EutA